MISRILLFSLFISGIYPAVSQECKYRTDKVDDFSNEKILETRWQTIYNHQGLLSAQAFHVSLVQINDQEFVELEYEAEDREKVFYSVTKSRSQLMFKLANDDVVTLEYGEEPSVKSVKRNADYKKGGDVKYKYLLNCKFSMTSEDKAKLSASPVAKVRLLIKDDEHFEADVEPKLSAPLLGISNRGVRAKKIDPTKYFMEYMNCLK